MTMSDIVKDRDKFLMFALAGSDLLLEVNAQGQVSYAAGAIKTLTGHDEKTIIDTTFMDLIAPRDRGLVITLGLRAVEGQRFGPIFVHMNAATKGIRSAMLCGIKKPGDTSGVFYYTMAKPALSMAPEAKQRRNMEENTLLSKDIFTRAALDVIASSEMLDQKVGMTLIDIPDAQGFRKRIGEARWKNFQHNVATMLRAYSVDGRTAGMLDQNRYGVVHGADVPSEIMKEGIEAFADEVADGGKRLAVETVNLDLDDENLSERELAKALVYTINQFEQKGIALTIHSLQEGLGQFIGENKQKIDEFIRIINQRRFNLKFQPIVDFTSNTSSYFEALVRFEEGRSPFEDITFCEDVGLSPALDLAIVGKVLEFLLNHPNKNLRISVNLSGLSVQDKLFASRLQNKLEAHRGTSIPKQLLFEITESSEIKDLEVASQFVKSLQDSGYEVCLDDFGAGAASFQYLHKLTVNHVKIDGAYIDHITDSTRDRSMVEHLVKMCHGLGIKVVAERVETAAQMATLKGLGITLGQGYLFAKPGDQPLYTPSQKIH